MGLSLLTDSTAKIIDYSDGVLPIDSINLWNQQSFEETSGFTPEPAKFRFSFHFESSTESIKKEDMQKKIFLFYLIIKYVPNEGLDELLDTTTSLIKFYRLAKTPYDDDAPLLREELQKKRVKLNKPSERPEFSIMPDEI